MMMDVISACINPLLTCAGDARRNDKIHPVLSYIAGWRTPPPRWTISCDREGKNCELRSPVFILLFLCAIAAFSVVSLRFRPLPCRHVLVGTSTSSTSPPFAMIAFTLLTALAVSPLLARAAPFTTRQSEDPNVALAKKYAPQLRFEKNEKFWVSSVDYFLGGPITPKDTNGNAVGGGLALSPSNLNTLPNAGDGVFLSTDTSSNGLNGFLAGQNPATTPGAKLYTFVAPKANDVVDLYYWLFTPYNLGKKVPLLGLVGDHVGDWERLKVRTVNGTAQSVEYHAHGDTGSGTVPWAQVVKFDNDQRPVGYVASGSHGLWSTPGTFTYVNAVIFKLQDVTSDGGVQWDTRDSLVVLNYPNTFTDDLSWLNFRGAWGNKGVSSCWWHGIYKECELVDAPPGPLRDDVLSSSFAAQKKPTILADSMDAPSSHVLASVSKSSSSSYTVYAPNSDAPYIAVRQTCTAESDGNASHLVHNIKQQTDGSFTKRAEPKSAFTYGVVPFSSSGTGKATVSVSQCQTGFSVTSYSVALCQSGKAYECDFASSRAIRAFDDSAAVLGVQATRAVTLNDLDVWEF
ncbi:hypothetical protein BKA62DRAFT_190693 [Auriculariales sp. MPI-PUGE-AT-0066]|nr:hypothetical protein BKA62DRAFT_190693 [Auriculariales sp. MPI-PUGE-AT-0066]